MLTLSTNTGLWRATGGFHSEDSTKVKTRSRSNATSEASPACPAVHTNLCVQSTPLHHKHEQPKYSPHCLQSKHHRLHVCLTCASCTPKQQQQICPSEFQPMPSLPPLHSRSPGAVLSNCTSFKQSIASPSPAF